MTRLFNRLVDNRQGSRTVNPMFKLLSILTIAAISAFTLSTTASAAPPTLSFDSDCVGTQWVIRNRNVDSFLVATPAGEPIGMVEVGAVYEPDDDLASVIIADTVIIRPSCEVLASRPTPRPTRLPSTGTSLNLTMLALALVSAGAVVWRVGQNPEHS